MMIQAMKSPAFFLLVVLMFPLFIRGDEPAKKTCEELGLRPQVVASFQIASDTTGFGITLRLENVTHVAIPGWHHTGSPTGPFVVRLERVDSGKVQLVEEHAFHPCVLPAEGDEPPARFSEQALKPSRKAVICAAIPLASSMPMPQAVAGQNHRAPYEIAADGEYKVQFVQSSTGKTVASVGFTVLQAGTIPIAEIHTVDVRQQSK
jgi:hypothetical protein